MQLTGLSDAELITHAKKTGELTALEHELVVRLELLYDFLMSNEEPVDIAAAAMRLRTRKAA